MQGLSYRQVSRILEISHTRAEAVQKIAEAIYQPKILAVKKQRNFIAVEETITKINGGKDSFGLQLTLRARRFWQSGLQPLETDRSPGISFWLF
ncbi:Mobile element protein [Thermococcus sp. 2319x1]|nr:Mobile element protein [Thermococcus sp. 2319x1]